jgi:hypothetical protein
MTPAPQRRWFQFSMRALLMVVTACCFGAGIYSWLAPTPLSDAKMRQRAAVRKAFLHETVSEEDAREILGDEVDKLKGRTPAASTSAPNS